MSQPLKVFRDLPGVAELERRAILEPALRAMCADAPEIEEVAEALFGTDADDLIGPDEFTDLMRKIDITPAGAVASFEAHGWDVTDGYGRLAYMFEHFGLLLAAHIYGLLPLNAKQSEGAWGSALEEAARKFKPSR